MYMILQILNKKPFAEHYEQNVLPLSLISELEPKYKLSLETRQCSESDWSKNEQY